jgi:hypothetical protein
MTINNNWASNVFRGRIGEAIVEAVLLEFGYQVDRVGREYQRLAWKGVSEIERFTPDLLVAHPKRLETKRVEVKTRSARPMSIRIDKTRLDGMLKYFPDAILVFVSSYNGSLNCMSLDKLSPSQENLRPGGYYEFNLLNGDWEPIWHYFPLVKPGERLTKLWNNLKSYLHTLAESRVLPKKEKELFAGEQEELADYIEKNWSPRMLEYDILSPQMKTPLLLNESWDRTRQINAFLIATELCGEENIGTIEFTRTMDKVLGESGEDYVTVDLQEIREDLVSYPDLLKSFNELVKQAADSTKKDAGKKFMKELSEMLPEGLGKVLLSKEGAPLEDAIEVDFRTALSLAQRKNCLDVAV